MNALGLRLVTRLVAFAMTLMLLVVSAPDAQAQVTAFRQAVAETAARDDDLASFYRDRGFEGLWTGNSARQRRNALLAAFAGPGNHGLPTARYNVDAEYARLMREKLKLEELIGRGGYGAPVRSSGKLEAGATGQAVVDLRNRLIVMGFLQRTSTQTYDDSIVAAVQRFQQSHGLAIDGTAGEGTLREVNVSAERRLQSVIVAMERERWINRPRGERHVWVNLGISAAATAQPQFC